MRPAGVPEIALSLGALFAPVLAATPAWSADVPPVHVVVFTHVEDNTPAGLLGSTGSRQNYLMHRSNLIAMAAMAESLGVQWTLQPDWKLLEAALLYEDAAVRATTNGKHLLLHLKEDRGVVIDPHSHENGGYNYPDVAHLLDSLGVGATTVIGGHIWDPALPQFQAWDRFRVPVAGEHYPNASWRGDILIGSGTPNHVNDPLVSGVWRPSDRDHYFDRDESANIVAIGAYKKTVASIAELIGLYRSGTVPTTAMLTFSCNINPSTLAAPGGLAAVADTVFGPLIAWRDSGLVVLTDFTSLVAAWQSDYGGIGYLYDAEAATLDASVGTRPGASLVLAASAPNPMRAQAEIAFKLPRAGEVAMALFDLQGRQVVTLARGAHSAGQHRVRLYTSGLAAGAYVCRLQLEAAQVTQRVIVVR